MKKENFSVFLFILISFIFVFIFLPEADAGDVVLSLNQTDYYFRVGQDASFVLYSDNSYGQEIGGTLSYTISQSMNQQGFQYSSTNTKSLPLSISSGKSEIPFSLGTSDKPTTLDISLLFSYYLGEQREVSLENIVVHFVSDGAQDKNKQNKISSSSKKAGSSGASNSQSNQNDQNGQNSNPFANQQQKMQQMLNQLMGSQQQPGQQQASTQQKLQNNQIPQDSSALKKEMSQQARARQQMKEEFQKSLSKNKDFQSAHKEMVKEGFNFSSGQTNPSSENSGSFDLTYTDENGQKATLHGTMKNGSISSLNKDTPLEREKLLNKLKKNEKFKEYENNLIKNGLRYNSSSFSFSSNSTTLSLSYAGRDNQTATIDSLFVNNTIESVSLTLSDKEENKENEFYRVIIYTFLMVMAIVAGLFLYKKINKRKEREKQPKNQLTEEDNKAVFDYLDEARRLLNLAKKQFYEKKQEAAYASVAKAIRLFLIYENGMDKEMTNDAILSVLRDSNPREFKKIKKALGECSLVEFAKQKPNAKEFENILSHAKKLIG